MIVMNIIFFVCSLFITSLAKLFIVWIVRYNNDNCALNVVRSSDVVYVWTRAHSIIFIRVKLIELATARLTLGKNIYENLISFSNKTSFIHSKLFVLRNLVIIIGTTIRDENLNFLLATSRWTRPAHDFDIDFSRIFRWQKIFHFKWIFALNIPFTFSNFFLSHSI